MSDPGKTDVRDDEIRTNGSNIGQKKSGVQDADGQPRMRHNRLPQQHCLSYAISKQHVSLLYLWWTEIRKSDQLHLIGYRIDIGDQTTQSYMKS